MILLLSRGEFWFSGLGNGLSEAVWFALLRPTKHWWVVPPMESTDSVMTDWNHKSPALLMAKSGMNSWIVNSHQLTHYWFSSSAHFSMHPEVPTCTFAGILRKRKTTNISTQVGGRRGCSFRLEKELPISSAIQRPTQRLVSLCPSKLPQQRPKTTNDQENDWHIIMSCLFAYLWSWKKRTSLFCKWFAFDPRITWSCWRQIIGVHESWSWTLSWKMFSFVDNSQWSPVRKHVFNIIHYSCKLYVYINYKYIFFVC